MHCRLEEDAGGFRKWYMPEAIVISAPLDNGKFHACYSYVVAIMHHGSFVDFTENDNIANIGKGSDTEEQVG